MDYRKLKHKILLRDETYGAIADRAHMSLSSLANKINGRTDWTRGDIIGIAEALELTDQEVLDIFFDRATQ